MTALADALNAAAVSRTKAGARHLMSVPAVHVSASDARLLELAAAFVGPAPATDRCASCLGHIGLVC